MIYIIFGLEGVSYNLRATHAYSPQRQGIECHRLTKPTIITTVAGIEDNDGHLGPKMFLYSLGSLKIYAQLHYVYS